MRYKTGTGILRVFLTAVLFIFFLAGSVFAEETYPQDIRSLPSGDYSGNVIILHSNDVHGAIDGYAKIAALRAIYESLGAEVILADAGDFSQGGPSVNLSSGESAVSMMNAAGYTVATIGNHDFDFGYDVLKKNLAEANFTVICANVLEGGSPILPPYTLYTAASGRKIGFFGLDTEESKTKANPTKTIGLTFLGKKEMYECAAAQTAALREQGADLVIALTHLGVNEESTREGNSSLDLYNNTQGIDYIIDGHSHTVMTEGTKGERVQSTGTKFQYIGVLEIDADGKISDHYLVDCAVVPPFTGTEDAEKAKGPGAELSREAEEAEKNAAVKTAEEEAGAIEQKVKEIYNEKVAVSETEFDGSREANRSMETNSGDLATDALLWYLRKDPSALKVGLDHTLAVINGGGIRAGIPKGDVTKLDINTVFPFGNTVVIKYITGEDLLEMLEASTYIAPELVGGYPQTAGIQFTLDTTKEFDSGDVYPGSTYHRPNSIRRVTVESVNGQPFRTEDTYAVAVNDFMAAGGDTFFVLAGADGYDTGIPLDELLIQYIGEELKGVLSEEKYGAPRGDQTIIK